MAGQFNIRVFVGATGHLAAHAGVLFAGNGYPLMGMKAGVEGAYLGTTTKLRFRARVGFIRQVGKLPVLLSDARKRLETELDSLFGEAKLSFHSRQSELRAAVA